MERKTDGGLRDQPGPQSNLHMAIAYASRGWPVLPLHTPTQEGCSCGRPVCEHPGKHPRTRHGLLDATRDAANVKRWWKQWPEANIGIATGQESGLVVIDIDPRHQGDEVLASWEREHGPLPCTVEVCTGGGGRHLYFVHPGGRLKSGTIAPGVDVKADGGYVVAPPSVHATGPRYGWEPSSHPEDSPVAPLPGWLLALLAPPPGGALKAPEDEAARFEGGRRNITLTSLAGTMRRAGLESEEILPSLLEANRRRCRPPLPDAEVSKLARGISRYTPAALGADLSLPSSLYTPSDSDDGGAPVELRALTRPGPRQWAVDRLIPLHALTVLFGGGGLAKSLLAMLIGDGVARGETLFGWDVRQGRVLYLDWELDVEEQTRRAYAVAAGLGHASPAPGLFYMQMELPLEYALPQIADWQREHEVSLTILDSFGLATLGNPTAAKDVIPLLRDLSRSRRTCLFIDHIRNLQPGEKGDELNPFGSVYKFNVGRSMLRVLRTGGDDNSLLVQLRQTKSNFGARSEPVSLRVSFDDDRVAFHLLDPTSSDVGDTGSSASSADRVYRALVATEDASPPELAAATRLNVGTVKNQLTRLRALGRAAPIGRGRWSAVTSSSLSPALCGDDGTSDASQQGSCATPKEGE